MKPADDSRDRQFASTLASGIDLLLCFRPGEPILRNRDFSQRSGLSRPTVVRLTHTLEALGFLRRAEEGGYRLGVAVVALGHPLLASMRIRPLSRPLMQALAREIDGTVSLAMRHRNEMIFVETARRGETLDPAPDIGAPMPIMGTACGRAWLAHASHADRAAVLNQVRVADHFAHQRWAAAVDLARTDLLRHGHVEADAPWQAKSHDFAIPIVKPVDGVQYILNAGVFARRALSATQRRTIAARLGTVARSVEIALGLR